LGETKASCREKGLVRRKLGRLDEEDRRTLRAVLDDILGR